MKQAFDCDSRRIKKSLYGFLIDKRSKAKEKESRKQISAQQTTMQSSRLPIVRSQQSISQIKEGLTNLATSGKGITARFDPTMHQRLGSIPVSQQHHRPHLQKRHKGSLTSALKKHRNSTRSQQCHTQSFEGRQQQVGITSDKEFTPIDVIRMWTREASTIDEFSDMTIDEEVENRQTKKAQVKKNSIKAKTPAPPSITELLQQRVLKRKKFEPVLLGGCSQATNIGKVRQRLLTQNDMKGKVEQTQSQECLKTSKLRSITITQQQSLSQLQYAYCNIIDNNSKSTPKFASKRRLTKKMERLTKKVTYFDTSRCDLTDRKATPKTIKPLKLQNKQKPAAYHQSQDAILRLSKGLSANKSDTAIRLLTDYTRNVHKVSQGHGSVTVMSQKLQSHNKSEQVLLEFLKPSQISLNTSGENSSLEELEEKIDEVRNESTSRQEIIIRDDDEEKKQRSALDPFSYQISQKDNQEIISIGSQTERIKQTRRNQSQLMLNNSKTKAGCIPLLSDRSQINRVTPDSHRKQSNCNNLNNNEEEGGTIKDKQDHQYNGPEQQEEQRIEEGEMMQNSKNQNAVLHVHNQQLAGDYISPQNHRTHLHKMIHSIASNSYALPRQQNPDVVQNATAIANSSFTMTMPSGTIDMNSALLTSGSRVHPQRASKTKSNSISGIQQLQYKTVKPIKQQQNKVFGQFQSGKVQDGCSPAASFKDNLDYVIANRIQLQEILDEVTHMQQRLPNPKQIVAKAISRTKTEESEPTRKKRSLNNNNEQPSVAYHPYIIGPKPQGNKSSTANGARSFDENASSKVKGIFQQNWIKSKQNGSSSTYVTSPRRSSKPHRVSGNSYSKQQPQTYITFSKQTAASQQQTTRRSTNFALRNSQQKKATLTTGSSSANLITQPAVHKADYKEIKGMTTPGIAVIPPHKISIEHEHAPNNNSKGKSKTVQQTKSTPAKHIAMRTTRTPDCDENAYGQKQDFVQEDPINNRVSVLSNEASKRIKTDQEHFGNFRITMTASHTKRNRRELISSSVAGLATTTQNPATAKSEYGQQRKSMKQQLGPGLIQNEKSRQQEIGMQNDNTDFVVRHTKNQSELFNLTDNMKVSRCQLASTKQVSPNFHEEPIAASAETSNEMSSFECNTRATPELVGPPPATHDISQVIKKPSLKDKKTTHTQKHHENQQHQSQSIKQLGLSYGVLNKTDAHNKLNPSKTKQRSSPAKKQHHHHRRQVLGKSLIPWQQEPDLMKLEGDQITYDEQNQQMSSAALQGVDFDDSMRKSAKPISRGSVFGGSSYSVPGSRFQSMVKTATPSLTTSTVSQTVQNKLIMKRMPELQVAPQITPSGVMNHLLPQTQRGRLFKYQIFGGNNANLIKRVMSETRSYLWMEMGNNQQSHYHFRWAPVSRSINFERLSHNFGQMVNHFENHQEITTKNELFKNWKHYSDERGQNAFHTIPLTFCLKISADRQAQSIKQQLKPFKDVFYLLEEFKDKFVPPEESKEKNYEEQAGKVESSSSFMRVLSPNSVSTVADKAPQPYEQFIKSPMTILITKKGQAAGYKDISNHKGLQKQFTSKSSGLIMPMSHFAGQNVWILKPTGFNCGKGIHVINCVQKLKKLIKEYSRGKETSLMGSSTLSPGSSNIFPLSQKFMEPQAMSTKQLMIATMQNSALKGKPVPTLTRYSIAGSSVPQQQLAPNFGSKTGRNISSGALHSQEERQAKGGLEEAAEINDTSNGVVKIEATSLPFPQPTVIIPMMTKATDVTVPSATTYQKPQIRSQTFIIQKYIERPMLIRERKFDIRVWVTLTHDMDVYFFREGYLRTSSRPYSMNDANLEDDFVHLTNNAIQKNAPGYGCHEDGNMLSFAEFKRLIKKNGNQVDFEVDILQKMKYQCAVTLSTIRKKINSNRRRHCFELFGFDFFIDNEYNVFLIEVNTNPCLEESSRLLTKLLPRLLDDLFKLTIDQIYLPTKDIIQSQLSDQNRSNPRHQTGKSTYSVEGYRDNQNMWEKIGALRSCNVNPIQVCNPHAKQPSRSDRLIHLVNQFEMRVAKPDLVEKAHRRDLTQSGARQLAGFVEY